MFEIGQTLCFCGMGKGVKRPFCRNCYHDLPDDLKRGLYATGEQFNKTYAAARSHVARKLRGEKEIVKDREALPR